MDDQTRYETLELTIVNRWSQKYASGKSCYWLEDSTGKRRQCWQKWYAELIPFNIPAKLRIRHRKGYQDIVPPPGHFLLPAAGPHAPSQPFLFPPASEVWPPGATRSESQPPEPPQNSPEQVHSAPSEEETAKFAGMSAAKFFSQGGGGDRTEETVKLALLIMQLVSAVDPPQRPDRKAAVEMALTLLGKTPNAQAIDLLPGMVAALEQGLLKR